MKHIFQFFLDCLLFFGIYACHNVKKKDVETLDSNNISCFDVAPPPPPQFHQQIDSAELRLFYNGRKTIFKASLSAFQLCQLEGKNLQTFQLIGSTQSKIDTFYFALPQKLNYYWQSLSIQKTSAEFKIGYHENENFKTFYTLSLGDTLNLGNIYMNYNDENRD